MCVALHPMAMLAKAVLKLGPYFLLARGWWSMKTCAHLVQNQFSARSSSHCSSSYFEESFPS